MCVSEAFASRYRRKYTGGGQNNGNTWFEEHKGELQHLPWPEQSPDLNIIEPL
jgi:hypothetical protein